MARTTKARDEQDAWQILVLRSMSMAELEHEATKVENTEAERRAMRQELARRHRTRIAAGLETGDQK